MKRYSILILLTLTSFVSLCQNAVLNGSLELFLKDTTSIKIVLYNDQLNKTTSIDSPLAFRFENIPYGIYNLLVDGNHRVTGYENLLITGVLVDSSTVAIYPLKLSKAKVCGRSVFVLGKKDTVEYYETGEIYGKGQYSVSRKYYKKLKSVNYAFKKHGTWNYYYKNGKLLRQAKYEYENLVSFKDFYENGNIKLSGHYSNCKSNIWQYYKENGTIIFEVDFSENLLIKINYKYLRNFMDHFEMMDAL